jgi:hypothetical protein
LYTIRTLQELLAPRNVEFFDRSWIFLGRKYHPKIAKDISTTTGIPTVLLGDNSSMLEYSIAQRMSWAAEWEASRSEDMDYALLSLFDIHMPMQYREGVAAFVRSQREVLKTSNDQSLFVWMYSTGAYEGEVTYRTMITYHSSFESQHGMFTTHPKDFKNCDKIIFLD